MNFGEMLLLAKSGDNQAITNLLDLYKPLLIKNAIVSGCFDEDLYQELCITFLKCIKMFRM